ncbi:MAG: hypothetical protein Q7W13_10220 [Bacteroidia bacterium]|nr:hypothetical protein [Bacteroidia bacterium]
MLSKDIIVSLIKDDLTNIRLVLGLERLGLDAGKYYLHLNETIFKLVGLKEDREDFFEKYIVECRTIHNIDIFKYPDLLNGIAFRLYNKLIEKYKTQTHEK